MGCDIHLYVEYRSKTSHSKNWNCFGGRINPGRNYWIFGMMADGVRTHHKDSFPKRGLPSDTGYIAMSDSRLYISDSGDSDTCSLGQALQYKSHGCKIYENDKGEPLFVDHPDWHSRSWLSLDEFATVINAYKKAEGGEYPAVEYEAVLAAMRSLESNGNETRIVFWFDN